MNQPNFIGVFVWGGIINHIEYYETLEEGIQKMDKCCIENRFDSSEDDARIFQKDQPADEIYSFDHEKYEKQLP